MRFFAFLFLFLISHSAFSFAPTCVSGKVPIDPNTSFIGHPSAPNCSMTANSFSYYICGVRVTPDCGSTPRYSQTQNVTSSNCPSNSTFNSSDKSCTCNSGYFYDGTSCVVDTCVAPSYRDSLGVCVTPPPPPPTCEAPLVLDPHTDTCVNVSQKCPTGPNHSKYGLAFSSQEKLTSLCIEGCQYRDAWREFVDSQCSNPNNPFYVPGETASCQHRYANVDGSYTYVVGSGTGESCVMNEDGGTGEDVPPPPYDPKDNNKDGRVDSNDEPSSGGGPGTCGVDRECTASGSCNKNSGLVENFSCQGTAEYCQQTRQSMANQCSAAKTGTCDPTKETCSNNLVQFDTVIDGDSAVSYTHLDVYKRQVIVLGLKR